MVQVPVKGIAMVLVSSDLSIEADAISATDLQTPNSSASGFGSSLLEALTQSGNQWCFDLFAE